jgi:hypothetical protein
MEEVREEKAESESLLVFDEPKSPLKGFLEDFSAGFATGTWGTIFSDSKGDHRLTGFGGGFVDEGDVEGGVGRAGIGGGGPTEIVED